MRFQAERDGKTDRIIGLQFSAENFTDERILGLLTLAAVSGNSRVEVSCDGRPAGAFDFKLGDGA